MKVGIINVLKKESLLVTALITGGRALDVLEI